MAKYVLRINRSKRRLAPFNWHKVVYDIAGVTLEHASVERMQIEVENDLVLQEIKKSVGEFCHIERLIIHDRS